MKKSLRRNKKRLYRTINNYKIISNILEGVYEDKISSAKALSLCNESIYTDVFISLILCGYIED